MDLSSIVLKWQDIQFDRLLAIFVATWVAIALVRVVLGGLARLLPAKFRIYVLPWAPAFRLAILIVAVTFMAPLVIKTSPQYILALIAAMSLALGFAVKDYVSSVISGVVALFERDYQVGDWIEFGGHYGEVRKIGFRAVHLTTVDDNEIIVPHAQLLTSSILNATSQGLGLQVTADFYLHPEHDVSVVSEILRKVATASELAVPEPPAKISIAEVPGATKYIVRVYTKDSRKQFQLRSEITAAAKSQLMAAGVKPASFPFAVASA